MPVQPGSDRSGTHPCSWPTRQSACTAKDWGTAKDELLAAVRLTHSTGLDKEHDVGGSGCEGSVPKVNAYFGKYSQTGVDIFRLYKISEASTSLWSRPTTTTSTRTQRTQAPSSTAR